MNEEIKEPKKVKEDIIVITDEVELPEENIKKVEIKKEKDREEIIQDGKRAWKTIQHWLETGELTR